MYKLYKKDNYTVMHFRFDSITEYITFLKSNPIRSDVFPNPDSIEKSYSFTQTHSLEEAMNLCQFGYHKDFDKFTELKMKLEKYVKMSSKKNKQYNDYIGYVPDVKAYLEGNPLSMLNKSTHQRKKIDIYMNTGYSSEMPLSAIFNRGAIVLNLVEILENLGYSVDFHLFIMAENSQQIHLSEYILKKETERVNPQKLYFPLCHPSWSRRLYFRLVEATKDVDACWAIGYGYPCKAITIKKILETKPNDIIIPTIEELNMHGIDIIDDANNLFDYVNQSSDKEFILQRIKK